MLNMYVPKIDPHTNEPLSLKTAVNAFIQGVGIGFFAAPKTITHGFLTTPPPIVGKK